MNSRQAAAAAAATAQAQLLAAMAARF